MKHNRKWLALALSGALTLSLLAGCAETQTPDAATGNSDPEYPGDRSKRHTLVNALVIAEQGIFSAGGTAISSDGTFDVAQTTIHRGPGPHLMWIMPTYFIRFRRMPPASPWCFCTDMASPAWNGLTTPDGRDGWSDMFLRMGHSVWLIDQPRRGEAGQTSVAGTITTEPSDQTWYTQFRIGTYLNDEFTYNEGSQFPQGDDVLDQFFRQMTPDTGMDSANGDQNIDNEVVARAVAAAIDEIYERTGQESIMVTHSEGGLPGWETAVH